MPSNNGLASFIGNILLAYFALNIVAMNIIPWHLLAGAPLAFGTAGHRGMSDYSERVAERGYSSIPWDATESQ